jgi:hypothetical protein
MNGKGGNREKKQSRQTVAASVNAPPKPRMVWKVVLVSTITVASRLADELEKGLTDLRNLAPTYN